MRAAAPSALFSAAFTALCSSQERLLTTSHTCALASESVTSLGDAALHRGASKLVRAVSQTLSCRPGSALRRRSVRQKKSALPRLCSTAWAVLVLALVQIDLVRLRTLRCMTLTYLLGAMVIHVAVFSASKVGGQSVGRNISMIMGPGD